MDQLLVALDVDTPEEARKLSDRLRGFVGGFKIGSRLFTNHGSRFVEELVERGDALRGLGVEECGDALAEESVGVLVLLLRPDRRGLDLTPNMGIIMPYLGIIVKRQRGQGDGLNVPSRNAKELMV